MFFVGIVGEVLRRVCLIGVLPGVVICVVCIGVCEGHRENCGFVSFWGWISF